MRRSLAHLVRASFACLALVRCEPFEGSNTPGAALDGSAPDAALDGSAPMFDVNLREDPAALSCAGEVLPNETPPKVSPLAGRGLAVYVGTGTPRESGVVCKLPDVLAARSRVEVDFSYLDASNPPTPRENLLASVGIGATVRLLEPKIPANGERVDLVASARGEDDGAAYGLVVDFDGNNGDATKATRSDTIRTLTLSYDFVPEGGRATLARDVRLSLDTRPQFRALDLSQGVKPSLRISNYSGRRGVLLERVRIYKLSPP